MICQANELSSMAESEGRGSVSNAEDDSLQTNGKLINFISKVNYEPLLLSARNNLNVDLAL